MVRRAEVLVAGRHEEDDGGKDLLQRSPPMKVENILDAKGWAVETISPEASMPLAIHRLTTVGIAALVVSSDGEAGEWTLAEPDIVRGPGRHCAPADEPRRAASMN